MLAISAAATAHTLEPHYLNSEDYPHKSPQSQPSENLIDRTIKPVRSLKLKVKNKTKKKVKKKPAKECILFNKLLGTPVPVSWGEYFDSHPKERRPVYNSFREYIRKGSKKKAMLIETALTEKGNTDPCYIWTRIANRTVPLFVDSGASYSLMRASLVRELGLKKTRLENPISLTQVGGTHLEVSEATDAVISLDDDVEIGVRFLVTPTCAVPAIFGLNTCKELGATLNYRNNTIDIVTGGSKYRFQLVSQDDLNGIGVSDEEYSGDETDEETTQESFSDSEGNIISKPMFYSLKSADLTESGFPEVVEQNLETEMQSQSDMYPEITEMLNLFSDIFENKVGVLQ
ncbi:hypothetical protein AX774_g2800 [Zancudomyces culisetae]|uniref:Aspartic peptidase DDI1-type domain-containing protein n=1 Tax=Zancudomyces culisetae TaxID=1213189 RepID=A0A1R1PRS9_ZANCU|nr:hypothetical protein AX774_g2800 [Zancudomyces culisetae]|eukprot:OMH83690.1 hypothetical protein AX774_g2800 [Zancudomyces culisetae]